MERRYSPQNPSIRHNKQCGGLGIFQIFQARVLMDKEYRQATGDGATKSTMTQLPVIKSSNKQ